jgi:hypothetical protein
MFSVKPKRVTKNRYGSEIVEFEDPIEIETPVVTAPFGMSTWPGGERTIDVELTDEDFEDLMRALDAQLEHMQLFKTAYRPLVRDRLNVVNNAALSSYPHAAPSSSYPHAAPSSSYPHAAPSYPPLMKVKVACPIGHVPPGTSLTMRLEARHAWCIGDRHGITWRTVWAVVY